MLIGVLSGSIGKARATHGTRPVDSSRGPAPGAHPSAAQQATLALLRGARPAGPPLGSCSVSGSECVRGCTVWVVAGRPAPGSRSGCRAAERSVPCLRPVADGAGTLRTGAALCASGESTFPHVLRTLPRPRRR